MRKILRTVALFVLIVYVPTLMPYGAFAEDKIIYTAPPMTFEAAPKTESQPAITFINIRIPDEVIAGDEFNIEVQAYTPQAPVKIYKTKWFFSKNEQEEARKKYISDAFKSDNNAKRIEWDNSYDDRNPYWVISETEEPSFLSLPNNNINIKAPEGFRVLEGDPSIKKDGLRTYSLKAPKDPGTYSINLSFAANDLQFSRDYQVKVRGFSLLDIGTYKPLGEPPSASDYWYDSGMGICGMLLALTVLLTYANSNK